MIAGVSTASLYPMQTEDAVRKLGELGVRNAEIFVNDISETDGIVFKDIMSAIREYGLNIVSVHPFMSPMETLFLFSDYPRRVQTIIDIYKRFFEFTQAVGARLFVLHGADIKARCTEEVYVERFMKLCDIAESYGAVIAQENVHYCKSGNIEFLKMLKRECGERARFVLDIKQAVRAGYDPLEIADAIGDKVVHLHISDNREDADCVPVGRGNYDIAALIKRLHGLGFDGAAFVELYRGNYNDPVELKESADILEKIIKEIK
ncbi:MAG: sugar phosphate isomerase/epimerase [Ruminiclostridium sp.]|nr:sugar phosphate isomerase/epimerase [Ruminiclostridium sp.]